MANEEFTQSLRKFLKKVGVTTQQEITSALEKARAEGKLDGPYEMEAVIRVDGLDLRHVVKGELAPDRD